jgi:O-antigen ligase
MQNKASFYIVLAVEILAILLAVFGILPREIVLVVTGIMVFYFIFSSIEDSLILFIISIPLFAALQITDNFDTMANWRILLAILFLVWFIKRGYLKKILKEGFCCSSIIRVKSNLSKFVFIFLGIGILSLVVATNQIVGVKKLLFLINIFLLFPIIRDVAKDERMRLKIIRAGVFAGIISLIVGYVQIISTMITPLYNFWQWWARNVISVFYGNNLSELVKTSNTWFSYYVDSPPTLRMFSIFPDSHSFALFAIIGLIFIVYLLKEKKYFWAATILSFFALIFSGSRAVWLSAVVPFLVVVFLLIFKKQKIFKPFLVMLIIFALAFPVSSLVSSLSYQGGGDGTLAFKRAKSIADMEELSVKSRMGIWKATAKSILKHPLLGVGIGNYPLVLGEDIANGKKGASAHNLYLDVTAETGLLGLIALGLIFLEILRKSWKTRKEIYFLIFTFFFVWILIYNLFDVVLLNDKVLLLFMVALALVYPIENYEKSIGSD